MRSGCGLGGKARAGLGVYTSLARATRVDTLVAIKYE